jgi:glycosyltransferase involved in cell wall biosynthesis
MKVAIVHDHLAQDGGAERVVQAFMRLYPKAPIFTLVYRPEKAHPDFKRADIRPSFIQHLPAGRQLYKWYLPLMPAAVERYDLAEYDLVVSSSASYAKGAITLPKTLHISYIHSPTRYLWSDTYRYVEDLPYPRLLRAIAPLFLKNSRLWDRLAADRPDRLVANSATVQQRIKKYYRRDSDVINPPVRTEKFSVANQPGSYYLAGGRLETYKRFDITVKAFNKLGLPLKIYGLGTAYPELKSIAKSNIEFLGRVPDSQLNELYGGAIAFLNPQEEDFGITVVEAMAAGRPVIAYAAGGAIETVKPGLSGTLFPDQDWETLADTVLHFQPENFQPSQIRAWAENFSTDNFINKFKVYAEQARAAHLSQFNV